MAACLNQLYPALHETTLLAPRGDCAILMDLRSGAHLPLSPYEAFLFSLCGGKYSGRQILELAESLEVPRRFSTAEVNAFLAGAAGTYLSLRAAPLARSLSLPDPLAFARRSFLRFAGPWDTGIPYEQPVEVDLYLTEHCNMRCRYCFVGAGKLFSKNQLTHGEFISVLEQSASLGVLRCTLTGGEPTLYPGFVELVRQSVSLGMYTTLASNGLTLSANVIEQLAAAGLGSLQVSLDSTNPENFGRITRAPRAYPRVIEAVKEAAASGIELSVKAVLTKINIYEAGDLIDRCASLGVAEIKLQNFEPGLAGRGESALFISTGELENLRSLVETKQRLFGERVRIKLVLTGERWEPGEYRPCRHALSGFGVLSNGDVTLCDRFGHGRAMILGNTRRFPLSRFWKSQQHLDMVKPTRDKVDQTCSACSHFAECRTGCFIYSLYAYGATCAPDPRCLLAQTRPGSDSAAYPDKINLHGRHLFCSRD